MAEVVVLKLSTGEEVMGSVAEVQDESGVLKLDFVLGIASQMQGEGKLGFQFYPYGPLVDKNKAIFTSHIVWRAPPVEGLSKAYAEATGKIVTPSKQLIIG